MHFTTKKISLFVLGVTAIACSRTLFFFFDDPEGPNLLIVMVAAAVIYFISLGVYLFTFSNRKKLVLAILIQLLIAVGAYFSLK